MLMDWYILQVFSGSEKKVLDNILALALKKGQRDKIEKWLIPAEDVIEMKRGKKINSERKFFPGYLILKMLMTDDIWHIVKGVPKVSGFLGGKKGEPSPVSQKEIDKIINQVKEGLDKPKPSVSFEVGEQVRVSDGPFTSFNGVVEEVEEEKARLKVSVSIFGRSTPVELEYSQVEKV
ncbi:MAG: transcription termination/antitermination protein NusG [Rickettsiales bacterium]|nr:transcription termination/antitermination protein NusG [Rickettsiales bacterium]